MNPTPTTGNTPPQTTTDGDPGSPYEHQQTVPPQEMSPEAKAIWDASIASEEKHGCTLGHGSVSAAPAPVSRAADGEETVSDAVIAAVLEDRELLGKIAYEAYRASINRTTDDSQPKWEWADHETQLAFRDAGEAIANKLRATTAARTALGEERKRTALIQENLTRVAEDLNTSREQVLAANQRAEMAEKLIEECVSVYVDPQYPSKPNTLGAEMETKLYQWHLQHKAARGAGGGAG